jgi:serine/threonine protein kinase
MPSDRTRAIPRAPVDPEDAPTHVAVRPPARALADLEPPPNPGAPLRAGTLVDRYLVLGHLGSGGLGDVYAAYDTELERKIAIKLVRQPQGPATSVLGDLHARALREAQALARLRHPNVVAVHDVGTYDEQIYLAMELVEGRTISMWLQERARGWKEIRDVFVQAGHGLAAAHAAGLVHRDFKLGNVLVAPDPRGAHAIGRVVVLDFGLARALEVGAPSTEVAARLEDAPSLLLSEELTDTRVVLGTPQYLAPELWAGGAASTRTDVFAFCVALHRCLYGVFPFAASTADEHRQAALAGRIDRGAASARVPGWLQRAVTRGLHGDPERRFDAMETLLEVLVTDRRRRRRALVAALVALPLLSVAVAVTAVALQPEPTAQEIDAARRGGTCRCRAWALRVPTVRHSAGAHRDRQGAGARGHGLGRRARARRGPARRDGRRAGRAR